MNRLFRIFALVIVLQPASLWAQAKPKDLTWTHAFDLACRKLGETDFDDKTQKFGVEGFYDPNNQLGLFITQKGSVALGRGFQPNLPGKGPDWITGRDLDVRKIGEAKFSKTTKRISLEVFRDPNTDNFLYVTEQGMIAAAPAKGSKGLGQQADWTHGFDLGVRKYGDKKWDKATQYSVEVYHDKGMGLLIYVCETGSIAVVPYAGKEIKEGKTPESLHGLDLPVRKPDEPSITDATKTFGLEVFRDVNTGNLIYISETGSIGVVAGGEGLKAPTESVKKPLFAHGINIKCRTYGEKEFSDKTPIYSAEVFRDENVGVVIAILEKGVISVVK